MVNKYDLTFLLTVVFSISLYAQEYKEFPFKKIFDLEYEEILKNKREDSLDGKYYILEYSKGNNSEIRIIEYKKGVRHGEWKSFYQSHNGMGLNTVINYYDGRKEGYYFFRGDDLILEGYYKKDKRNDLWTIIKEGNKEKIRYARGIKNGSYWKKDEFGTITTITTGKYKKDKKEGVWLIEDTSIGQVTKEVYKDGVLIE